MVLDYKHSAVEYTLQSYAEIPNTLDEQTSFVGYGELSHLTHDIAVSTHARTIIPWAGGTKAPHKLVYYELSKPKFRIIQ